MPKSKKSRNRAYKTIYGELEENCDRMYILRPGRERRVECLFPIDATPAIRHAVGQKVAVTGQVTRRRGAVFVKAVGLEVQDPPPGYHGVVEWRLLGDPERRLFS